MLGTISRDTSALRHGVWTLSRHRGLLEHGADINIVTSLGDYASPGRGGGGDVHAGAARFVNRQSRVPKGGRKVFCWSRS